MGDGKEIYIKNMVCDRCIMAVTNVLAQLGLTPVSVTLGRAELPQPPTDEQRQALRLALDDLGFELIDDQRIRIVEHIKQLLIELTRQSGKRPKTNLSHYLAEQCRHDYSALSRLFSETQGITIEKYFIAQKIERAKELLEYGELSLNEIADQLGYSSAAHLSSQFKTLTGLTPRQYKQRKEEHRRMPLDKV